MWMSFNAILKEHILDIITCIWERHDNYSPWDAFTLRRILICNLPLIMEEGIYPKDIGTINKHVHLTATKLLRPA
jgi:hypothetical protein